MSLESIETGGVSAHGHEDSGESDEPNEPGREILQFEYVQGQRFNASEMIVVKSGSEKGHLFSRNVESKIGVAYRCNHSRQCRARVFVDKNVCFKLKKKAKSHEENHQPPKRKHEATAALTEVKKQVSNIKTIVKEQRLRAVKEIFDNVMEK